MSKGPLLEFQSSLFVATPGEDGATNPGVFGRGLAEWLAEQLAKSGVPTGEIVAEDFGWCVPVASRGCRLWIACASAAEVELGWRLFVFAEGGIAQRLTGRDPRPEAIRGLHGLIANLLRQEPRVVGLREIDGP